MKRNLLQIGTTGGEAPFLAEADLPACARLNSLERQASDPRAAVPMQEEEDRMLAEALAKSAQDADKSS